MTTEEFDKIECKFTSEYDPKTKGPISKSWSRDSFKEIGSNDDSLFKVCA